MSSLITIQEELIILCKFLHTTFRINYGGCCFIAEVIAKNLEKLNIPYKLIIFDGVKKDNIKVKRSILNRNNKNLELDNSVVKEYTCNHYTLQIGNKIINTRMEDNDLYKCILTEIHSKDIHWIYKQGHWNNRYDTTNNPYIRKIINNFFKKYEC